jgi:hypothetical protein
MLPIDRTGWDRPFLDATGTAPYLGCTAAELATDQWNLC